MKLNKILAAAVAFSIAAVSAPTLNAYEDGTEIREEPAFAEAESAFDEAEVEASGVTGTYMDFSYELLEDGTVSIDRYNGSSSKVVIPDMIYGKKVTAIGQFAFGRNEYLTEVEIPDSVASIGANAFYNCTVLKKVKLSDSLTSIGEYAFWLCSSLTDIRLPDGLTSIGSHAFSQCKSLAEINIPNSVISIGEGAFVLCESLAEITIPESVSSIGNYAFGACYSLTAVNVNGNNEKYTSLDGVLFNKKATVLLCYPAGKETTYTIPDGVVSLQYAFVGCIYLKGVKIPDSVKTIFTSAFEGCSSITEINMPNSVTYIGDAAFRYCESLAEIKLPDYVTYMGLEAFKGCTALTSIEIPYGASKIDSYAFMNCTALAHVVIPDTVTVIGSSAFANCTSLTEITIPDSAATIAYYSFSGSSVNTIYGYTGSYAEHFADWIGVSFIPIGTSITEGDTKVKLVADKGAVPSAAELSVKKINSDSSSISYDITITENGKTIQPDAPVTVKIPVTSAWSSSDIYVYRMETDGKYTDMHAVKVGGYACFTTDHFSEYIITTEKLVTTIRGDVNNSGGTPNNDDLIALAQYLANWTIEINMEAANVDGDAKGLVNNDDLIMLAQLLAGWKV